MATKLWTVYVDGGKRTWYFEVEGGTTGPKQVKAVRKLAADYLKIPTRRVTALPATTADHVRAKNVLRPVVSL